MGDLIEALGIFGRYADLQFPVCCEHDAMYIMGVERNMVSDADHKRLADLSFLWNTVDNAYISFRFGSA